MALVASSAPVLASPSAEERAIIRRVVDPAPQLGPTLLAELSAIFGGSK